MIRGVNGGMSQEGTRNARSPKFKPEEGILTACPVFFYIERHGRSKVLGLLRRGFPMGLWFRRK